MNEQLKQQLIDVGITTYYGLSRKAQIKLTTARIFWKGGNSTTKTINQIKKALNENVQQRQQD